MRAGILWLVVSMVFMSVVFAQEELDPGVIEPAGPPRWVRVGTFVAYGTQASVVTGSKDGIDALTTIGYLLYLVTNVAGGRVYGIEFQFDRDLSTGLFSSHWELKELGDLDSFLYFLPELVGRTPAHSTLSDRDSSISIKRVEGEVSLFSLRLSRDGETLDTTYFYTSEGVITKALFSRNSSTEAESVSMSLIGIYNVEVPVLTLPDVARQNTTYSLAYGPFTGPSGIYFATAQVRTSFLGADGDIAMYSLRGSGFYTGKTTILGNQLISRFYINPDLLRSLDVFSVPDVGFSLRITGVGRTGGLIVTLFIGNEPVEVNEYDPRTGLLLASQSRDMGLVLVRRLVGR